MDSAQLLSLVGAFGARRVAGVGDIVADEFVYGRVARVSREAPVLILEYDSTEVVPGGAGNAANNVAALGGRASLVSVIGRDEPGRRALLALNRRVDTRAVRRISEIATGVKTRILAGGVHSAKQQVVRIDRAVPGVVDARMRAAFARTALDAVEGVDAVLISDYGSGLVGPLLAARIRAALKRKRRLVPILVDSRYRLLDYTGFTLATPNQSEVEKALGVELDDDATLFERAGRDVLKRTRLQALLITRGSRGMALFTPDAPTLHIPIFGTDSIVDVTGAGDTVVATMALALATGASFEAAAYLANYAGGLVVMKRGTATVSGEELRAAVSTGLPPGKRGRSTMRG